MVARPDHDARCAVVEQDMRAWMEKAVIGLNLCPFAKAVVARGQVHFGVSLATTPEQLATDLELALRELVALDPAVRDTTLLMAPDCLADFLDFNDFLGTADRLLRNLRLQGVVQIASFHPDYQFADTTADDITNYTNRAPYPTLHLLREDSLDRAVEAFPDSEAIFGRNMQTLRALGIAGWRALGISRTASVHSGQGLHPQAAPEPDPELRGKIAP